MLRKLMEGTVFVAVWGMMIVIVPMCFIASFLEWGWISIPIWWLSLCFAFLVVIGPES